VLSRRERTNGESLGGSTKRKNMSNEEIMWSVKEWVPHPGKSHTRDTKFFHLAEVYWMTKAMVAQAMV
jgi:hypothetical protein